MAAGSLRPRPKAVEGVEAAFDGPRLGVIVDAVALRRLSRSGVNSASTGWVPGAVCGSAALRWLPLGGVVAAAIEWRVKGVSSATCRGRLGGVGAAASGWRRI